jgi:membrane-associated PAP2 superfamily phosphatase
MSDASPAAAPRTWIRRAFVPGLLLAGALAVSGRVDLTVADFFFYDPAAQAWIGAHTWWAVDLIHTGGGWLVRIVGLAAIVTAIAGLRVRRLRPLRRQAVFIAAALALCPAVVGGLKQVTNVDCPRDLERYGGSRPYVSLFGDRPDELPRARCYPGSHASSGFALMSLYFVLLGRRPRLAQGALAASVLTGMVFSFGQQARGAHFLSHDLASAAIAWLILLALRRWLLESPAPDKARLIDRDAGVQPTDGAPPRGTGLGRRQASHPAHAHGRRAGVRGVLQRAFRAGLPVCASAPQWRRRGGPGGRAVHADEGDAQDSGLPGRIGPVHLDLPDLPP